MRLHRAKKAVKSALMSAAAAGLLGQPLAYAANTGDTVVTTATDLSQGTSYTTPITPTAATTVDVQFSNSTYTATTFDVNGSALKFGTLNDLDASQSLIITNTSGTAGSITLSTAANSTTGSAAADVLYVASGANLTLQNGTGTLGLILGVTGSFDIVGTASISSSISGAFGFTKTGAGTLTLGGANTYTGVTTVNVGVLQAGIATSAFGSNSAVTLANVASVVLSLNNFNESIGSLAGGGTTGGTVSLGSGTLTAGGNNTSTTFAGLITGTGGITKAGTATLTLSGTNSYTGITTITGGTLAVTSLANGGSNSTIGASSNAADNLRLGSGTTFLYTGTGSSSDRLFTLNGTAAGQGASVSSSGTGALNLTNTGSIAYGTANQTRTLTLGGTYAGANMLAALITNNGTGAVTVNKKELGTWLLTNANTYTGGTTITAGTLEFARTVAMPVTGTVTVSSGATLGAAVGGAGEFTIDGTGAGTIAGLLAGMGGQGGAVTFASGSYLGIDTTDAGAAPVVYNGTLNSGVGLAKLGSGTLTFGGTLGASPGISIGGGTLALSSSTVLPATAAVQFNGGTSTLNLGTGNAQTVGALNLIGTPTGNATYTITGSNSSLTIGGGTATALNIAPANIGATTALLDLSDLTSFTYNYGTAAVNIYGAGNGSGAALTPTTVAQVQLSATTNSITAASISLGASTNATGVTPFPLARLDLGTTNTFNLGSGGLIVGGYRGNGLLDFQSGLTNPTLTIRGLTGGVSSVALITVGSDASGGGSSEGAADLTNSGGTGAGTIDAIVTSMIVGAQNQNNANLTGQGTFTMALGTINAGTILLAQDTGTSTTQTAIGTFNQRQGTVLTNALTFTTPSAAGQTVTATYVLGTATTPATLAAKTIGIGTAAVASNTASRSTLTFSNGVIENYDPALGQAGSTGSIAGAPTSATDLTISGLTGGGTAVNNTTLVINLAATGTHALFAESGHTITVAPTAILAGAGGTLAVTGPGTVLFQNANTYTGTTSVAAGTLALGYNAPASTGASLAATAVSVARGATLAVIPGNSVTNTLAGTLNLNAGANFTMADGATSTFSITGTGVSVIGGGGSLTFDLNVNASAVDTVNITGAATVGSGEKIVINSTGSTAPALKDYTLISTGGTGLTPANFYLASSKLVVGGTTYSLSLANSTTSNEVLTISMFTGLNAAYWTGSQDNVWNTINPGPLTNFATDPSGNTNAGALPDTGTDVYYTATTAQNNNPSFLGANFVINTLNFTSNSTASVINSDVAGNTAFSLTLNAGLTNASASNQTVNAPIILGRSQTWTNTGTGLVTATSVTAGSNFLAIGGTGPTTITNFSGSTGGLTTSDSSTVTIASATLTGAQTWASGSSNLLTVGAVNTTSILTLAGPGNTAITGNITGTGGGLTMAGTGTLTLSGVNSYTAATTLISGTIASGINDALSNKSGLVMGDITGNAGTLNLGSFNQTITSLTVNTSSATNSNTIVVGSGKTLKITGNVVIGPAVPTATLPSNLTISGGGSLNVATAASGLFQVGGSTTGTTGNPGDVAMLDLTGLNSATINVSATGTIRVNNPQAGNTAGVMSTLLLPTPVTPVGTPVTTFTSNVFNVGDNGANSSGTQVNTVVLGTGLTTINANTVNIGIGGRDAGAIEFGAASDTGTLLIRAANGTGAAAFNMGTGSATTGAAAVNTFDVTGHNADLLFSTMVVGGQPRSATRTDTFSFDTGIFSATTVQVGFRSGTTAPTAGTAYISNVNFGGGSVTIGSGGLELANNTATGAPAQSLNATVTVSGGSVTIGNSAALGAAVRLVDNAATTGGVTATGTLKITGGSVTVGGDIIKTAATSTMPGIAVLTLDGGALDMAGHNIGGATPIDTLNFNSGTLKNVGEINNGSGLTKLTSGTLILDGTNTYTGGTAITGGVLQVGSGGATGTLGAGAVTLSGNAVLAVNRSTPFTVSTSITGVGALTQSGTGVTTLTAVSGYTGATNVISGGLEVDGSLTATTGAVVAGSAMLKGTGSVAGNSSITGTVAPGNGIGSLTLAAVTLTGKYQAEYDNTGAGSSDQLNVSGLLTLGAGATLDFTPVASAADDPVYIIATYGSLSGQFSNFATSLPSGYSVDYHFNNTNEIAVVAVPEPAMLGLLGLSTVGLLLRRRRRP